MVSGSSLDSGVESTYDISLSIANSTELAKLITAKSVVVTFPKGFSIPAAAATTCQSPQGFDEAAVVCQVIGTNEVAIDLTMTTSDALEWSVRVAGIKNPYKEQVGPTKIIFVSSFQF